MPWKFRERLTSYRVDRQTNKVCHKQTLLKTIPPSLRNAARVIIFRPLCTPKLPGHCQGRFYVGVGERLPAESLVAPVSKTGKLLKLFKTPISPLLRQLSIICHLILESVISSSSLNDATDAKTTCLYVHISIHPSIFIHQIVNNLNATKHAVGEDSKTESMSTEHCPTYKQSTVA